MTNVEVRYSAYFNIDSLVKVEKRPVYESV